MKLKKRFGPKIRHLHCCTDQRMTDALAEMELTASQGHAMAFINHQKQPPLTKDFEEVSHLSHACAVGILSRLEKKGFIEFRTDPEDKRCRRIYVLPRGAASHRHMHETMEGIEERMVRGFSEEEKALFREFLDRAIANMDPESVRCSSKEETKECLDD